MARVEISYKALKNNISVLKGLNPNVLPVIKARAYYHGNDVAVFIAKQFSSVCVNDFSTAMFLRDKCESKIYVLYGYMEFPISFYNRMNIVPILGDDQIHQIEEGCEFGIFAQTKHSCHRRNVKDKKLKHVPSIVFEHFDSFERPVRLNSIDPYVEQYGSDNVSLGSSVSLLKDQVPNNAIPRIGLSLYGYSSDGAQHNTNLLPVKSFYAKVIDRVRSWKVGYCHVHDYPNSYTYVLDAGESDNVFFHECDLYCNAEPNATINLINHFNMCNSFISSDTKLPIGSDIELLGENVRADKIANSCSMSVANVLKLGSEI